MADPALSFRTDLHPADREAIRRLVEGTGFFSQAEVAIALELVDERLRKGDDSGYHFLVADRGGRISAYACYGPIPGTRDSFDLYWLVVDASRQRRGIGGRLLVRSERRMAALGARRVYADTSARPQYAPTRAFYEACGYQRAALLEDFYAAGDGKIIYVKEIAADSG